MNPFAAKTLAAIEEEWLPAFYALLGVILADKMELEEHEARGEIADRTDFQRLDDLRLFTRQVRDGMERTEGTNPRLAALLQHPDIQALPMRQIGIVTLESLRDRLRAELAAPVDTGPWPRPFRYIAKHGKHRHDGRLLKIGDVVDLNESQAEAWRDKFVPVAEESASA
jgi:hypothetical protein